MSAVALVDAGGANLASVRHALERQGARVRLVRDADGLRDASRAVLPGVGAAAPAMARLREQGLDDALRTFDRPLLGVCLGMQLLHEHSEEGDVPCLGRGRREQRYADEARRSGQLRQAGQHEQGKHPQKAGYPWPRLYQVRRKRRRLHARAFGRLQGFPGPSDLLLSFS